MKAVVLGAAAGGAFPQWNSNAAGCRRSRAGDPSAPSRSQCGIAVSANGEDWVLLNASPDLRQQIESSAFLHPQGGLRSSPIVAVALTGADVDAIAGLLSLREGHPFTIYATARVHAVLDDNPIFNVLPRDRVLRRALLPGTPITVTNPAGAPVGLTMECIHVPGKPPLYLEAPGRELSNSASDDTVGIAIDDGRHRLLFIPGCAAMTEPVARHASAADVLLFDGTLWRDDEMIQAGIGVKTGKRMGHMSLSGADGTLAAFAGLPVKRKVLVHLNNSNPALLADSHERAQVEAAGWEVAYDGMELLP